MKRLAWVAYGAFIFCFAGMAGAWATGAAITKGLFG